VERLRYLRLTGRQRVGIWLTLLVLALLAAVVSLLWHLKPVMTSMATARVSNLVNRIVSAAVNEAVENGSIDYQNFVIFEKDETGHITALRSNVAEVNRMQGQIADEILHRLSEVATSELEIPLGTLTGSALLAGRGPSLFVRMQAVGSASAAFRNQFTAAGINQTRHQIFLDVDVYMSILLPGMKTSTRVSNEIAVAETVIVGGVPDTYTYFSTMPDEIGQYAEDYIMNNG
jgi:sporulation protein YunB